MSPEFGRGGRPPNEKAKTILIVDDEIDITDTFGLLFELNGFQVMTASNGQEALLILKDERPELILSDCMMPIMDGMEFCTRLQKDSTTKDIPLILMSAAPELHDFSNTPHHLFIRKPFKFADLLLQVRKLLKIES